MARPEEIYDLLLDYAALDIPVQDLFVGVNWTLCRAGALGLAGTPPLSGVQRPWDGILTGRTIAELAPWLRKWDRLQAAVGMAAVNAALNAEADMVYEHGTLVKGRNAMQMVFESFLPKLRGQRVAVVGTIPGVEGCKGAKVFNHLPYHGEGIDPACEYLLPQADWVFLTDDCIPRKSFPRLVELAEGARVVLLGPSVPWLDELAEFGVDYIAGAQIDQPELIQCVVAEGGGTAGLDASLCYRIAPLARTAPAITPHVPLVAVR